MESLLPRVCAGPLSDEPSTLAMATNALDCIPGDHSIHYEPVRKTTKRKRSGPRSKTSPFLGVTQYKR